MTKKRMWIIAAAGIILFGLVSAFFLDGQPRDSQPGPDSSAPTNSEGGGTDKKFSTDVWGRRIEVLDDHGKPRSSSPREVRDVCAPSEQARPLEDLTIQLAFGTQTVWSKDDGPTTISEGFPDAYSKSPAGAALAAWNFYAVSNAQGVAGQRVLIERLGLPEAKKKEARELANESATSELKPNPGAQHLSVPDAYRVLSCSADFVVIELAKPLGADASGPKEKHWQVFRFPMLWVDDHWEINGTQDGSVEQGIESGLDESWLPWQF